MRKTLPYGPGNFFRKQARTSNYMFGRTIWEKLLKCIFENFANCQTHKNEGMAVSKFSEVKKTVYLKNHSNQTCDYYWLITSNQQTLCCTEMKRTITNQQASSYKILLLTVKCRLQSVKWSASLLFTQHWAERSSPHLSDIPLFESLLISFL